MVANCKADVGSCVTATEVKPPRVNEEAPRAIAVVPTVTELFVNEAFAMLLSVLLLPLIDLFVSVWAPVKVATVESIAIVTGDPPLKLVPDKPVPMVKAAVAVAVMVPEAPSATLTPLKVTELLVKAAFGMLLNVFELPLIDLPVNVDGMSSLTSKRKVVGAAAPDVGPAYT